MELSLSIIVPVHNAEFSLADTVGQLLDIAADLVEKFEILIVDNGSNDHTFEVASELIQVYPQLRIHRLGRRVDYPTAIQAGLDQTSGSVVFVHDSRQPVRATELRNLWRLRNEQDLLMAQIPAPRDQKESVTDRLTRWGVLLKRSTRHRAPGLRMIRRAALHQMAAAEDDTQMTITRLPEQLRADGELMTAPENARPEAHEPALH